MGLGIGVARFNIGPLQVAQSVAVTPIDHVRSTAWSTIAATAIRAGPTRLRDPPE